MHLTESQASRLGIHVPKRVVKRQKSEQSRELFLAACRAHGLPEPVAEFRFHPVRRWRFDWCWESHKIAVEVQGGLFVRGRHTQGAALLAEYQKLNEAQIAGWRVFLVSPKQVGSGEVFEIVKRAMGELP